MSTYNGHKNRNYWNVALWIGNDEGLYRTARNLIGQFRNRMDAARSFVSIMENAGITHTPDGSKYTVSNVRAAMVGL